MKVSLQRMRCMLSYNAAAKAAAVLLAVSLACPPQFGYAFNLHNETPTNPTKEKNRGGVNSVNSKRATAPTPNELLQQWLHPILAFLFIQTQDQPVLPPAPGFTPPWGASAGVYGGSVNLGNGNLTLSVPIVSWNNGLHFSLIFNSQANGSSSAPIGRKWTHTYRAFLTASGNNQILTDTDGSEWTFTWNGSGYNSPAGNLDRLVLNQNGSRSLFRHGSDEEWRFNSNGRLQWIKDKHGKQTNLTYASGRLVEVKDPYDRTLTISYTYQSGHPQTITLTDPQSRVWTLHYDSSGRLVEMDYPTLNSTTYDIHFTYNSNHNVTKWTDRLDQEWTYQYGSSDPNVLVSFKDPDENEWTAIYSIIEDTNPFNLETGYTRWIDPTGVWVEYGFSSVGNNRRITHGPAGGSSPTFTTLMTYNNAHQVTQRTDPAGLVWEYTYDSRGNRTWMKEPNGAETTYTYYTDTDNLHTVTNALNQTWTYTYTNRNDVKTIEDPEEALTTYEYEYETVQNGRGVLVKITDPLERETELEYYNAAGYDYLKKVIAPGGYWREFTYDTLGRLQSRVVQVSGGTQTTSYTYDSWGRLTTIDYPTSDDVSYTYDAENRRLSMTDGIGTQEYEYDAWGRVTRKTNCCGGEITSTYDPAGRRLTQTEEAHERTIESTYDALGRLETIGDYRGTATYTYDSAGRLSREDYPNETYVQYTYYGSTGSQAGQLHKQEHRLSSNNSLIIGYEYSYDALGRVVLSVETPSEDTTEYEYWASGRLKKEERKGDVAYSREYAYNPDGSRDIVIRDDALNGSFWDVYVYNETSGRLESVMDIWTTDTHEFEWKPEGTLARWIDPNADYERVFSYDEEGRLTKIERDHGQSVQTAYEYSYTGDGVKAEEIRWYYVSGLPPFSREYRFGCSIVCGRVPLRLYQKINNQWESYEEYLSAPTFIRYGAVEEDQSQWENGDYAWLPGHLLSDMCTPIDFRQRVYDRFGVYVGSGDFDPQKIKRLPFHLIGNPDEPPLVWFPELPPGTHPIEIPEFPDLPLPKPLDPIDDLCDAIVGTPGSFNAGRVCNRAKDESGLEFIDWCDRNYPECGSNPLCCIEKCVEAITGQPWDEVIRRWIEGYREIWEEVGRCARKRGL